MPRVRKHRERVTLDQNGQAMSGFFDWFNDDSPVIPDLSNSEFPVQSTSNPDIVKQIVPTGTPVPTYVTGVTIGFPSVYYDSWYFPTNAAYSAGRAQAALDTVVATGDQIGAVITKVGDVGAAIANNFVPLLIGIAAIWLFMSASRR